MQWDLRGELPDDEGSGGFGGDDGQPATPGIYMVRLTVDGTELQTTARVLEDVWLAGR